MNGYLFEGIILRSGTGGGTMPPSPWSSPITFDEMESAYWGIFNRSIFTYVLYLFIWNQQYNKNSVFIINIETQNALVRYRTEFFDPSFKTKYLVLKISIFLFIILQEQRFGHPVRWITSVFFECHFQLLNPILVIS